MRALGGVGGRATGRQEALEAWEGGKRRENGQLRGGVHNAGWVSIPRLRGQYRTRGPPRRRGMARTSGSPQGLFNRLCALERGRPVAAVGALWPENPLARGGVPERVRKSIPRRWGWHGAPALATRGGTLGTRGGPRRLINAANGPCAIWAPLRAGGRSRDSGQKWRKTPKTAVRAPIARQRCASFPRRQATAAVRACAPVRLRTVAPRESSGGRFNPANGPVARQEP